MPLRRVVLAIGAGIVLLLGGLGSAGAAGCVSNSPDATDERYWIGIKGVLTVDKPEVSLARGSGQPLVRLGICVMDDKP